MADPTANEIMIVTGEASGDMHGARLVEAMRARRPELTFCGMGGPALAAAGVEILFDASRLAVVGVVEVLAHGKDILAARATLVRRLKRRPTLLILIDYPDFNLLLAKKAKKMGITVFYYITPQVWAWRRSRARIIGRRSDSIGVILPFEADFFARQGITAHFVGHPLLDVVHADQDASLMRHQWEIAPGSKVVGLLPGSRSGEIQALLPVFLAGAAQLAQQMPLALIIPKAPTVAREVLEKYCQAAYKEKLKIIITDTDRYAVMAACDAAVAASGTVTLELAILGVPMVVAYRLSPLSYRLGRLLIRHLRFFSLVNLVAERQVVPELLQEEVTASRLCSELTRLLQDPAYRQTMRMALQEVRHRLGTPGAAARAAALALKLLPC